MARLAKLRSLSASERRELLLAVVLLPAMEIALRLGGLRLVHRAIGLERRSGMRAGNGGTLDAQQLARLVAAAARWGPWRASCMVRSLTLQCLLKRHGLESRLRLGVRKAGKSLEAHAWVEHQGRPLNEPANVSQNFAPFEPFSISKL
jgi:hypothetical protein